MARWLASALLLLSSVSCGADSALSARHPTSGSVTISVALEGNGADADGFAYEVGQAATGTVAAGQPVTVPGLTPGSHTVRLDGLAPHCQAPNPEQSVVVNGGDTTAVEFVVECFGGLAYAEWYSPNNQQLFYLAHDGTTHKLTQLVGRNVAREWSPDGTRLLFENDTNGNIDLYSVRFDGNDHQRLTTHQYNDVSPRWSPDGLKILFTRRPPGPSATSSLYIVSPDGAYERPVIAPYHADYDAAWTRDGSEIIFSCDRFERQFDLCIAKADGSEIRTLATLVALAQARLSPDGTHVAMYGFDTSPSVYVAPLGGSVLIKLTPAFAAHSFDWSPDGQQLVLQTYINNWRVHRVNRDGTDLRELRPDSVAMTTPRWSPDGEWIAYIRTHPVDQQVWIMRSDGTQARRLTAGFSFKLNPVWNPKAMAGTGATRIRGGNDARR